MPELPDVEGQRRFLTEEAVGRTVVRVEVPDDDLVRNTTPQGLGLALKGASFERPRRHGKWLIAPTSSGSTVVLHFGMNGYLVFVDEDTPRHDHDRVVFVTDGGELRFNDMRKFGGVWLASDEQEVDEVTGPLGPDALDVDRGRFRELLGSRRGGIKSALMDQELIAGLGNLLADEMLWRARIHPRTAVAQLSHDDLDRLHATVQAVLEDAVPTGRVPPVEGWLTGVRDDEDPHCPRCGSALQHSTVNSRSTWTCPDCQR